MNLAGQAGDHTSEILFLNFNQDYTSLAVGTKTGYKLLSFSSVEKLEQIYDNESDDIYLVERLFASSLVAVVSLSSPRKLKVCHFKKGTEICNYSYNNSILGVKLNRQRLIVCLEESLFIHNIRDMKVLHTIRDTPPNPHGLCALSINNDNCFLAYPGSSQIGEVQIFDTVNLRAVTMIPAHDNPLAALSFNSQATKLATASEKGTVIRVFSIPDGQKLFEFRRGVKRCVNIYSLAFSSDSLYLSTSSNTETVHIFKLETPKDRPNEEPQSWMGYIGQALKTSANYLPAQVSEMLNQGRAFATARLPNYGFKNVCAISPVQKIPRLVVASLDGYLYMYNIDPNEGGECMLLRQHRLDGKPCESHVLESPLGLEQDKPLAQQTGTPITYACTVKRPDAAPQGTPPPSGKVLLGAGQHFVPVGTFPPSPTPAPQPFSQQLETYARVLKRGEGPKSCTTEECEFPDIAIILAGRDSQPYEEFDQGAVGGSDRDTEDLGTLQLDDDNEFPPMIHKIE